MYNRETGIREVLTRATGTGWEAAYRQDVGWLLERVGELEATIANDHGRGDGPSGGWSFSDTSWCRGDTHAGPWLHVGGPVCYGGPWKWSVTRPCCPCGAHTIGEWPTVAEGTAPTAREAMRAADKVTP